MNSLLAFDWLPWVIAAGAMIAILVIARVGRLVVGWWKLRRLGTPIPLRWYVALRMRGIDVEPIAAAHWATKAMGGEAPLEVWISFGMLRVDVVKLAAALAVATKDGLDITIGQLGATALTGYDPLEVVQAARSRGMDHFTNEDLNELSEWGLAHTDHPA